MGKDRSKDGDATTSSADNKDPSREQESRDAALARTIAEAVALQTKSIIEMFSKQKSEETKSIVEMFSKQKSEETQSITEAFSRQMEKTHVQYEELLKASCAQNFPSALNSLLCTSHQLLVMQQLAVALAATGPAHGTGTESHSLITP